MQDTRYDQFTDRARRLVKLAEAESRRLDHEYVGTEHLLLAVVKEGTNGAAQLLLPLGIDYRKVRLEVERIVQAGPEKVPEMSAFPLTPRTRQAIEFALVAAQQCGQVAIDIEHVFLGLLRAKEGVACQVLSNLGADVEALDDKLFRQLGGKPDRVNTELADTLDEGFTGQIRRVLSLAHREAHRLDHDYLGTEHLLLGLLQEGSRGVAVLVGVFGTNPERLYREIEPLVPRGEGSPEWDQIPLTPGARRALDYARLEAGRLQHRWIGPEHLLVGTALEPESLAAQLLAPFGVTAEALREELARLPEPQNQDWAVGAAPHAPGRIPATPSPNDLQAILTTEPLPASAHAPSTPSTPNPIRLRNAILSLADPSAASEATSVSESRPHLPSQAELDLPVVERQLRSLQILVGLLGGFAFGAMGMGFPGGVLGAVCGVAIAFIRNPHITGLLGFVGGLIAGGRWELGIPAQTVYGGLIGLLLGVWLGDWRRLKAPPGSG